MEVYVSRWSLRRSIARRGLKLADLPAFVTGAGFDGLELTDREIGGGGELAELRRRCDAHGCGLVIDVNCDLTLADPVAAAGEAAYLVWWLRRASEARVDTLRITLGGQTFSIQKLLGRGSRGGTPGKGNGGLKRVTSSYPVRRFSHVLRTLLPPRVRDLDGRIARATGTLQGIVPGAEALGVCMGIENHWGVSTRPEWILRVVEGVDSPSLGTCPDFGNFPRTVDPCAGLAMLLPRAVHLQAKSWRFDDRGEETTLDYACCMGRVRESGYRGPITVEYEGNGDDLADCLRTKLLIGKYEGR